MKKEYIITNEELTAREINLEEYAVDSAQANSIILDMLDDCVTLCCTMNDDFKKGELSIEEALDKEPYKVSIFKKLQYQMLRTELDRPTENVFEDIRLQRIISHELGWGKINGFQKGVYKGGI